MLKPDLPRRQLLKVNEKHHADLFWAIRGGLCSNFGVVTQMTYALPKVKQIIMYSITYDFSQAAEVLKYWLQTAPRRSNQFNEDIGLSVNGQGSTCEIGGLYVVGKNQSIEEANAEVKQEVDGLIKLGGTFKYQVSSYFEAVDTLANRRSYIPFQSTRIFISSEIIDSDYVVKALNKARQLSGTFLFAVDLLGGKIADKSSSETAYYPRQANFFYEMFGFGQSVVDVPGLDFWVDNVFNDLYNMKTGTVYLGFIIPNLKQHLIKYYHVNRFRLGKIKQKYDPDDVLRQNQGINV